MTNHAAQLAIIKHVTRQESRSSAGNCQADEPTGITQVKGLKKIFHANGDQKKARVAILISDKIDFKTKAVKRDKVTT